mmetsp:Transcript_36990/g.42189  ORF Transcript_36990/g.42189 Transcript_36990/m.42189 type:complete len:213 (+) Transcript_36990:89-727(+)
MKREESLSQIFVPERKNMDDYVNSEKKEYDKNLNQRNRDGKTIMDTSQTAYITATESRNESFDGISNSYSEEEEEDSLLVGDDGSLIDGESKNHKCRKILVGSIFLGFLIFVVVDSATTRYLGSSISINGVDRKQSRYWIFGFCGGICCLYGFVHSCFDLNCRGWLCLYLYFWYKPRCFIRYHHRVCKCVYWGRSCISIGKISTPRLGYKFG